MTINLKVGMEVYCDLHPKSRKHVITGFRENRKGFAIIDDKFLWPIISCFPCETTQLPEYDEYIHSLFE